MIKFGTFEFIVAYLNPAHYIILVTKYKIDGPKEGKKRSQNKIQTKNAC